MLGPAKSRRLDEPIAVSLDELVPRDNFYRHLEAKVDLNFVRDWTRELYAERDRPSIDPVVFFKLQLVMFSVLGSMADRREGPRGCAAGLVFWVLTAIAVLLRAPVANSGSRLLKHSPVARCRRCETLGCLISN